MIRNITGLCVSNEVREFDFGLLVPEFEEEWMIYFQTEILKKKFTQIRKNTTDTIIEEFILPYLNENWMKFLILCSLILSEYRLQFTKNQWVILEKKLDKGQYTATVFTYSLLVMLQKDINIYPAFKKSKEYYKLRTEHLATLYGFPTTLPTSRESVIRKMNEKWRLAMAQQLDSNYLQYVFKIPSTVVDQVGYPRL